MRRSKEQRRTDYLDIGAGLVAESAGPGGAEPGFALAHVKLADVADRAGVTKGALYHIWPSQEAFWNDLLAYLMDGQQLFGAEKLASIGADLAAAVGTAPTLREFGNALFDTLSHDPSFFARVSLFSYLDDDRVRAELDRSFRDSVQRIIPVLEKSIGSMGRRIIDGATSWDFAVAVAALLDGLCLQYRIDPARTPDVPLADGVRWSLFAAAALALLEGYTQLLDDGAADAADAAAATAGSG